MKISKRTLIIAGLVIFGFSMMSFVSAKKTQMKAILEKLKIKVMPDFKSFKITDSALKFRISVGLENHTGEHFNLTSGGMVSVGGFRLIKGGRELATGSLGNLSSIEIPAYKTGWIKNVEVEIPLMNLVDTIKDILFKDKSIFGIVKDLLDKKELKELFEKAKNINWEEQIKSFSMEVDIEGAGQRYTHRQSFA